MAPSYQHRESVSSNKHSTGILTNSRIDEQTVIIPRVILNDIILFSFNFKGARDCILIELFNELNCPKNESGSEK